MGPCLKLRSQNTSVICIFPSWLHRPDLPILISPPIIIDAEDTDVIVLSSLVSHIESGVLGIRRKKSSFYCNELCSPELTSIIVQLHVLTGPDSTSGFFGRDKNAVVKNVLKNTVELHSFYFEFTIFKDSLFDKYILFLSSYSCTFMSQTLCFYSDSYIFLPPISCFALSWLMGSIDNHERNVVFHKWLLS